MTPRDAAVAWYHAGHAAIADTLAPFAHGTVVRASRFPTYWNYNCLRVETADPALEAAGLAGLADAHLAGLEHRQVGVEDEATGERLRAGFEALGWRSERLLTMVYGAPAAPDPAEGVAVREVGDAAVTGLREQWYRTLPFASSEAMVQNFMAVEREVHELLGVRALAVPGDGPGGLVGYVAVHAIGATGEVGEAYAVPAARGRGLGAALVTAGVRLLLDSGVERVLIVADDEDRPKRLYGRLGFAPAWVLHEFVRDPG